MGKTHRFPGFLVSLFIMFFTANVFAAGYTCPTVMRYTSCIDGYYLSGTTAGNTCLSCSLVNNTTATRTGEKTENITNGKRVSQCTRNCTGVYTEGMGAATNNTSREATTTNPATECSGCSSWGELTNCGTPTCNCDSGYHSEESDGTCQCVEDKVECGPDYFDDGKGCSPNRYWIGFRNIDIIGDKQLRVTYGVEFPDKISGVDGPRVIIPYKNNQAFLGYFTEENGKGREVVDKYGRPLVDTTTYSATKESPYHVRPFQELCDGGFDYENNECPTSRFVYTPPTDAVLYAHWGSTPCTTTDESGHYTTFYNYSIANRVTDSSSNYEKTYFGCQACPTDYPYVAQNVSTIHEEDFSGCYKICTAPTIANGTATLTNTDSEGRLYWNNGVSYSSSKGNPVLPDCQYTVTCNSGYKLTNGECQPNVYTITLDGNGGSVANDKIYEKYSVGYSLTDFGTTIATVAKPERTGYAFTGYYTAQTGGTQVIDSEGKLPANTYFTKNTTLYAQWSQTIFTCTAGQNAAGAACAAGSYCPGGEVDIAVKDSSTQGCQRTCPDNYTSKPGNTESQYCYRDCVASDVPGAAVVVNTDTGTNGHGGGVYYNGTKYCQATTCTTGYCLGANGTCVQKPDNSTCTGDPNNPFECNDHYTLNGNACQPNVYTITLDGNGGSGGSGQIFEKYAVGYSLTDFGTTIATVAKPERTGYAFTGYYTAQTGGTQVIDSNGKLPGSTYFDGDTTLYAQWSQTLFTCTVGQNAAGGTCANGYYCPGGKVNSNDKDDPTLGCQRTCPADTRTNRGTVSSGPGSQDIDDCISTRTGIVDHSGVHGTYTETCPYVESDGAYGKNKCTVQITACDAGYYLTATDATVCNPAGMHNYSPAGETRRFACSALVAGVTAYTDYDTTETDTKCYITCETETVAGGHRDPTNEKMYYDVTNKTFPACTYKNAECNDGYKQNSAKDGCEPGVYKVQFFASQTASEPTDTAYLKYGVGWYSNSAATIVASNVRIPSISGQTFYGYIADGGKTSVADVNGKLVNNNTMFTSDTNAYALWQQKDTISCNTGTYYNSTTKKCTPCTDGSYCPGGDGFDGEGDWGRKTCPTLTATNHTAATNATGTKLTPVVHSDANASAETDCYATNLHYGPQYGTGSQSCYYANGKYNSKCFDISMITCVKGYHADGTAATDCSAADYGYYSADKELNRHPCPELGTAGVEITTDSDTSESIAACKKGNIWYKPTGGHTGYRRSCHYSASGKQYSTNCAVPKIVTCDAGYYYENVTGWKTTIKDDDNQTIPACATVGDGYYSPDPGNSQPNSDATDLPSIVRHRCPDDGLTGRPDASLITQCYLECKTHSIAHGTATVPSGKGKVTYSTTISPQGYPACVYIAQCDDGYTTSVSGETTNPSCGGCPSGSYCGTDGAHLCPEKFPLSEPGSTQESDCYKECEPKDVDSTGTLVESVTGRWHSGQPHQCTITRCKPNKLLKNGQCMPCPTGKTCDGTDQTQDCEPGYYCDSDGSHKCPDTHPFSAAGSTSKGDCYRPCPSENGIVMEGQDYIDTSKNTCKITGCPVGQYLDATTGECDKCLEDYYCPGGASQPKPCPKLYPYSDSGATDDGMCYANCETPAGATGVEGRNYKNPDNGICKITGCESGQYLDYTTGQCKICENGYICPGGSSQPISCPMEYPESEQGISDIKDCYKNCPDYADAHPDPVLEFYGGVCKYFDDDGNACKIVNDRCVNTSCKGEFELIGDRCQRCVRENALSYKPVGNCIPASCIIGYHPNGLVCEEDVAECNPPHATRAERAWNSKLGAFDACIVYECEDGYHVASNACEEDTRVCDVQNGAGRQEWNHKTKKWGECEVTSCDPGYTNEWSETNEHAKQCGQCKNKFSVLGELAASSYISGCEIGSCIGGGEVYHLEDNECVPICPLQEYTDETGSMKRVGNKCVRTCNDGYTAW